VTSRPLRVLFSVPTFNAGETTRGLELAKALAAGAPDRARETEIRFLSSYDESVGFSRLVAQAGFKMEPSELQISREEIEKFLAADHKSDEFVTDPQFAQHVTDCILRKVRDGGFDLIIHGFSPVVGIAAKITGKPAISFTPFPTDLGWVRSHMLKDVPDALENAVTIRLPRALRKALAKLAGKKLTERTFFTQPTLSQAARNAGWQPDDPGLCGMLAQQRQLICDLPDFYEGHALPAGFHIVGPLFASPQASQVDPEIEKVFAPGATNKVFVVMGSSAEKPYILEAAKTLLTGGFRTVLVTSPETCPMEELKALGPVPEGSYITDRFVPSHLITPMADVTVIHGGQGTVQTAISSGVPLVGVAMQPEQQGNLDNVAACGAGMRVPRNFWEAVRIGKAVRTVLDDPSFRANANRLRVSAARIDARARATEVIWDYVAAQGI